MIPPDPSRPEPSASDLSQAAGSELPALYANPWGLLAQDLRAVVADLRLQGLRWLRRNRQGDLPLPGVWPKDLAPLFWPLAIALALAVVMAVASLVVGWVGSGRAGSGGVGSSDAGSPAPLQQVPPPQAPSLSPGAEPAPAVVSPEAQGEADGFAREPQPLSEQSSPEYPSPEQPSPEQRSPEEQTKADLAGALAVQEGGQWIADLTVEPESTLLRLQLKAGFTTLAATQQQKVAEDWQALALGFGFDRLELTDRQGRVLGRQALVGSGMILLSPQHLS